MSTNLFTRPDTFLGVCEAIGQDVGIHANWLRVALGVMILWQPIWAIAGYLAVALFILALRFFVRDESSERPPIEAANDAAIATGAEAA